MKRIGRRPSAIPLVLALLIVSTIALVASPVHATDCSTRNSYPPSDGSGIAINTSDPNNIPSSQIGTAIGGNYWGDCAGVGSSMPSMCTQCSSYVNVTVQFISGESTNSRGSCGRFTPTITVDANTGSQRVSGGKIEIWESERGTGVDCGPDYSDTLAHEIGHVLGLADATASDCKGSIMGSRDSGQTRSVEEDDCQEARDFWTTNNEPEPPENPRDDGGGPCAV